LCSGQRGGALSSGNGLLCHGGRREKACKELGEMRLGDVVKASCREINPFIYIIINEYGYTINQNY